MNAEPIDHPINVAGSPENRTYHAVVDALKTELSNIDACGIAVVVLIPWKGGVFTVSSVMNRDPVTRHMLISGAFREVLRWHGQLIEREYTGWRLRFLRWIHSWGRR